MLQTIDVLIGFALVMLILSAIVTMLVQWLAQTLYNLKGRVLKEGVAHLLRLLDNKVLQGTESEEIADHLLKNTLVGKKRLFGKGIDLASAIHREELVKLILDFAGDDDFEEADRVAKAENRELPREDQLRAQLRRSLQANELTELPGDILKAVRATMLVLEQSRPDLANDARQSLALATHASSEFLAKLNAWFDQTIDRTSETFTRKARLWTVGVALVVALFFQVDTFQLLQRLSTDKEARNTLVKAAIENPSQFATLAGATSPKSDEAAASDTDAQGNFSAGVTSNETAPADTDDTPAQEQAADAPMPEPSASASPPDQPEEPAPAASPTPTIDTAQALRKIADNPELQQLVDTKLIAWPASFPDWWYRAGGTRAENRETQVRATTWYGVLIHLFGVLLTAGLLTLGAPVWYEILKNLIQLRSITARKDDEQRTIRQTNQAAPTAQTPPPG